MPGINFEKVIFDNLADGLLQDYRINQRKSLIRAERSVGHLKRFFEANPVPHITTPRINHYIESRLAEGASHASINRELSALKRMLNLGAQQTPPMVDIKALRDLETQLITELYANPTKKYITQYQGEIIEKEISLTAAERAQAANNLANVQHKRIALERQAYNIDGTRNSSDPLSAILDEVAKHKTPLVRMDD